MCQYGNRSTSAKSIMPYVMKTLTIVEANIKSFTVSTIMSSGIMARVLYNANVKTA